MKHEILLGTFIGTAIVAMMLLPGWLDHHKKETEIKRDGCPAIGTRVSWMNNKVLIITQHSGTPNYVYAHEDGYYGSSTYSCGDLKVLTEIEK